MKLDLWFSADSYNCMCQNINKQIRFFSPDVFYDK